MTSAEFAAKYKTMKQLAERPVSTYIVQELSTRRVVMAHHLVSDAPALLASLDRLDPADRGQVIETADVDGVPVVVTKFLHDYKSLAEWLVSKLGTVGPVADAGDGRTTAIPSTRPVPAAPVAPVAPPAPPPQATFVPPRPTVAGSAPTSSSTISDSATQPMPAVRPPSPSPEPATAPRPIATRVPAAPSAPPPAPPSPPVPPAPGSFTGIFGVSAVESSPTVVPPSSEPAPTRPAVPPPPPPPAQRPPGEFTRIFQATEAPKAQPPAPPPPPPPP
ncbi:MAG TPA: hypothetical protein VKA84_21070, partial [Gemmatimonadaceae bacterium]|nr:hypothetical protein [Gemmatimonadaceae bacterium]